MAMNQENALQFQFRSGGKFLIENRLSTFCRVMLPGYVHLRGSIPLIAKGVAIRPAEFLGRFSRQTPSLSLTQTVTPYQFLGPYNIVLPRHESFEVGHFILILALKWPILKLSCRGKMMS